MSGIGGRFVLGLGGQGRGRGRDGTGRGGNTSTATSRKKGLFDPLGGNIFTYNKKGAADQLSITLCQIIKHIGTIYRQEISNKIHKRTEVIIVKPVYDQDLLDNNVIKEGQREENVNQIQDARRRKEAILHVDLMNDPDLDITLAKLQMRWQKNMPNTKNQLRLCCSEKKSQTRRNTESHQENQSRLEKHRGQTLSMILG